MSEKGQKEAIAKAPAARVRRTPVGRRNVLTVSGKKPGYVYRVVNDEGNRIQQFKDAGYVISDADEVTVGDKRIGTTSSMGSGAEVSVGGGKKAYVMEQREEFYNEDQAAKQAHIQAIEDATRQEALKGTYGDLKIERS